MSMCRVFSCVGRAYLLWPVCSLGKTLSAFSLLHSVLQGQICLLLQVFLNFLFLPSSPQKWIWVLVLEGLVGILRTIQLNFFSIIGQDIDLDYCDIEWIALEMNRDHSVIIGVEENSWESLGLQGDPTSPFLRKSALKIHWKDWCWSWNSNTLAPGCKELTHLKRPWCWKRLRVEGEGDDRRWDGWMASPTQWTWVWVNSRSWWQTGRPGVLQSMGLQNVRHNWATELNCKATGEGPKVKNIQTPLTGCY